MKAADRVQRLIRAAEGLMAYLGPWAEDYEPDEPQMRALEELREAVAQARARKTARHIGGEARWQGVSAADRTKQAKAMAKARWAKKK